MLNILLFLLAFASTATLSIPAYAYLDPGTGSMILQILLGGVAGALVVGRLYWEKIKRIFVRRPAGAREIQDGPNDK